LSSSFGFFFLTAFLPERFIQNAAATSYDSLTDVAATGCIGLSLVSSLFITLPFDGYAGVIVAGIILYAGFTLTKETISPLLGELPDEKLIAEISRRILAYEKVAGIHDLIVHTYGPANIWLPFTLNFGGSGYYHDA
jgi:divalent metal cation (Fe/Co/Zn/Cd) transporter